MIVKISISNKDTWKEVQKSDVLLVRHDNDCGYIYKDKKYSTLINSIEYLYLRNGYKCLTIAQPYSENIKNSYSITYSLNRFYLLYIFFRKFYIFKININFINYEPTQVWTKVLEKSQAKIVIGIQPDKYLCLACKFKNIPVYDLQHGAIESSIKCYEEFSNNENKLNVQTTGFLLWDKNSLNLLKQSTLDSSKSFVLGHPFLYRFEKNYLDDCFINDLKDYSSIFKNNKPNILITTQPKLQENYKTNFKLLPNELIEIIKETQDKYNYFIRAHPVDCEIQLDLLYDIFDVSNSSVCIKEATEIPLPSLLLNMNLHITYHSAVVLESSIFGIKSILLNPEIRTGGKIENLFLYERITGYAKVIENDKNKILKEIDSSIVHNKNKNNVFSDTENILIDLVNNSLIKKFSKD